MNRLKYFFVFSQIWLFSFAVTSQEKFATKPNILFVITDDQSWENVGVYGDNSLQTPAMDGLAKEGIRFENAYAATSSCSPSRAAIVTGQDIWRLEEGGLLGGFLRMKFETFPLLLEQNGYHVGASGKKYWPAILEGEGIHSDPMGRSYEGNRLKVRPGLDSRNYAANFEGFLEKREKDQPFLFWMGIGEPHIPYVKDFGKEQKIKQSKIKVPSFLPDTPEVRNSLANYLGEIQVADNSLNNVLRVLKEKGLEENTIIIFTSDNGMPFPRAKATLYDYGTRMPLLIKWKGHIKENRVVSDPVSLIDIAPTLLEIANVPVPKQMTGRSMTNILFSDKSGHIDKTREFVVSAFEFHTGCREGKKTFPRRAIYTEEWAYIRNYNPERLPAGCLEKELNDHWGPYGDVDPTEAKFFVLENKNSPKYSKYFSFAFDKVEGEQLYDKKKDPGMIDNLAYDKKYSKIRKELKTSLEVYMLKTKDPRAVKKDPWTIYTHNKRK